MYSAIVLACVFVTFVMTLSHCHRCIEEVKGIFKAIVDPLFSNTNLFAHRIFRRNMVFVFLFFSCIFNLLFGC